MIIFVIVLIIVILFVEKWSVENALKGVDFKYEPSKVLLEPDERFDLITTVTNTSRRFIPFIHMEEILPNAIDMWDINHKTTVDYSGNKGFSSSIYLMPRQKLSRRVSVSISKRGRYLFRGANLSGGDFLGIKVNRKDFSCVKEVVVYPKESDAKNLNRIIGGFLGDVSVKRFIIEDPILISGFRDYTGREPMKAISWTQSSRVNRLMVKQFDFTSDPSVSIILNVECEDENRELLIEECFSLTRSICGIMEERGIKYDFSTNATTKNIISDWSYINEGLGSRHFFTILEGLGRAYYDYTEAFDITLNKFLKRVRSQKSLIIITPYKKLEQKALLDKNFMEVLVISAEEVLV